MSRASSLSKFLEDFSAPAEIIFPDENFDQEELSLGISIESENVDLTVAKQIAKANLLIIPNFYTQLRNLEIMTKLERETNGK